MKRTGFTLVEILVVISIIALLLALTMPALQRSRLQAKAVVCSSNIKQLTLALIIYDSENQSLPFSFYFTFSPPPPGGWAGNACYDKMGWWWLHYINAFSKKNSSNTCLICPSKSLNDPQLQKNILCGNYGVNQSVCKSATESAKKAEFAGKPLSPANISNASQTLLIADSGYAIINWWHATTSAPHTLGNSIEDSCYVPGLTINNERTNFWSGQEKDAICGRHPGKTVNVGFVDGHVSRKKANELLVEKTDDHYKNRTPLWKPR